jgi:hypothetical protein
MRASFNEKLIAYLALISGLSVSAVAVYYSVAGLTAIFASAVIPIIIMGVVLEVGKIIATVWIKQNWSVAPRLIRSYLIVAIVVLMLITSMGIFGFLSKAHFDQSMPTGDVVDRIAIIDEKIRTEKENIDANRKALQQMDAGVDQIMSRTTDERGATRAAALRKSQQRERNQLQNDIVNAQEAIRKLNEERIPIAKELRKVEAEVGPIKYIAAFVYGNTDSSILEKAVTWVIISIIVVFDPLAIILLLASQISFQSMRESEEEETPLVYVANVGEKPTEEEKAAYEQDDGPLTEQQIEQVKETAKEFDIKDHPYLFKPWRWSASSNVGHQVHRDPDIKIPENYVQNEEQTKSNLWSSTVDHTVISKEAYEKAVREKRDQQDNPTQG